MRLRLKTKFTLTTSLVVLGVVAIVSGLYLAALTRQAIRQLDDGANYAAQQIFLAAQQAFQDAAASGDRPASASAADLREYVRHTLAHSNGLARQIRWAVENYRTIYEITIVDRYNVAMVSSDDSLPGHLLDRRPDLSTLVQGGFLDQLSVLHGPPRVFEVSLPFTLGGAEPFGEIRVGMSSALLRNEIVPSLRTAGWFALAAVLLSTLLAAMISHATLAPLARISSQLDRISAGEANVQPVAAGDELGQVSTKISRIGKELHDVREIFGTLRENLNQIMAGLEDGLLLFNAEGRAVLVSPSAGKFLDAPPDDLLGRTAGEIFPEGHPLRGALHMESKQIESGEAVEVRLETAGGTRRVSAGAQVISEQGARIGTLVTLRDLESLERIGMELQVSERLASLGRVTAGVAHEVKNPLNSMRVWLEVLKVNLPAGNEPQEAAQMLDSEIDRLDRVVKTFLDFTRPVELEIEESDPVSLLEEVLRGARPAISAAGVELTTRIPKAFPPVRMDRQLIYQAILNLVLNACDAMARGGRLAVSLSQAGDRAEICVSDTGRGIPPENRAKIFQLFFTTRQGGTGMGLANAFRFVQLHGGSIEFESEVGRGTSFRIDLPLAHSTESSSAKLGAAGETVTPEK
ncbi:MAG TPA: ATP-binding protein [Candidatus Acidoferrales bacterium]|jgi:signal transduction histidine kinase/HAMP domain-containing protein|nr:ATP-binding protein [Candidatus Acidoferrales bacterium]